MELQFLSSIDATSVDLILSFDSLREFGINISDNVSDISEIEMQA